MYYKDNHITVYNKDCREMSDLADESIQCVVTSPPYWGLRKYSGEQELIWGDENCEHQFDQPTMAVQGNNSMVRGKDEVDSGAFAIPKFKDTEMRQRKEVVGNFCSLCGAWKGAYGLEPTPEMYVQHTIEILREIRRVLRKDGVVFWNIGDSYNSGSVGRQDTHKYGGKSRIEDLRSGVTGHPYLKSKDLCLIPFRVAIAAQEDGWWVRSVIIWSKPNPMPESVIDRPTESHEYILMLTKSAKYCWDADAVREPMTPLSVNNAGKLRRGISPSSHAPLDSPHQLGGKTAGNPDIGRNIRSVWEFPTQPYPEAHFAVFPEKLPEICIKAATPEVGCCSKCGAPWERITKQQIPEGNGELKYDSKFSEDATGLTPQGFHRTASIENERSASRQEAIKKFPNNPVAQQKYINQIHDHGGIKRTETLGWQPTCKCNADKVPSVVLDPFAGAGTTLWVSKKLNRRAVGYEISEEYCKLASKRNEQQVMM